MKKYVFAKKIPKYLLVKSMTKWVQSTSNERNWGKFFIYYISKNRKQKSKNRKSERIKRKDCCEE